MKVINQIKIILYLFICIHFVSCLSFDKEIRSEERNVRKHKVLLLAHGKDSISDYFEIRKDNYFIYSKLKLKPGMENKKNGVIKEFPHICAGKYVLNKDTLFIRFFKNYKPTFMGNYLILDSSQNIIFFHPYNDTGTNRILKIKTKSLERFYHQHDEGNYR